MTRRILSLILTGIMIFGTFSANIVYADNRTDSNNADLGINLFETPSETSYIDSSTSDSRFEDFTIDSDVSLFSDFRVHTWIANSSMGRTVPSTVRLGDKLYVCYEFLKGNGPFKYDGSDALYAPNGSYSMTITVIGPDGLGYTRTYNNSNYNSAGGVLPVTMLTGRYTATITASGSIKGSSSLSWDVLDQEIVISRSPTSTTITEGNSVTFSVSATGTNLEYQWFEATSLYYGGSGIAGATSSTYTMTNVSKEKNDRYYYCIVSNYGNAVASSYAKLTVEPEKTRILDSGSCGSGLTWTYDADRVLTISGNGAMEDYYSHSDVPWAQYRNSINKVVVERGVTSISAWAFCSMPYANYVDIADTVESIGHSAFASCGMFKISLPVNLKSIGDLAFASCNVSTVTIPSKVSYIGNAAFGYEHSLSSIIVDKDNPYYCSDNGVLFDIDKSQLLAYPPGKYGSSYTVPDGVAVIDDAAFVNCYSLNEITLPKSLQTIGSSAFASCGVFQNVYYLSSKSDWEKISISDDNNDLINGNIHYLEEYHLSYDANGGSNAPSDITVNEGVSAKVSTDVPFRVGYNFLGWGNTAISTQIEYEPGDDIILYGDKTLFAIWEKVEPLKPADKFTMLEDEFSFDNTKKSFGYPDEYKIALDKFKLIYPDEQSAQTYYDKYKTWSGSCFGMAAASGMFFDGSLSTENYDISANNVYDIPAPQNPTAKLTELLELIHITQWVDEVVEEKNRDNYSNEKNNWTNLGKLITAIQNFVNTGKNPIILSTSKQIASGSYKGHAVLPIGITQDATGDYIVSVYDNNFPDEIKTVRIYKELDGFIFEEYGYSDLISYVNVSTVYEALNNTPSLFTDGKSVSKYATILVPRGSIVTNAHGTNIEDIDGAFEVVCDDVENIDMQIYKAPYGEYIVYPNTTGLKVHEVTIISENDSKTATLGNNSSIITVGVDLMNKNTYMEIQSNGQNHLSILSINNDGARRNLTADTQYLKLSTENNDLNIDCSETTVFVNGYKTTLSNKYIEPDIVGGFVWTGGSLVSDSLSSSISGSGNTADFTMTLNSNTLSLRQNVVSGSVALNVSNTTRKSLTAQLILAIYSYDGVLQGITTKDVILGTYDNYVDLENIKIPISAESGCYAKCFLWEDNSHIKPLSDSIEMTINQG